MSLRKTQRKSQHASRLWRASASASNGSEFASTEANVKQAEILMAANEAALTKQYDRANAILARGKRRMIATAYKTTTPESALVGEFADRGWNKDELIEVSCSDIEAQHAIGSRSPVTDAIVKQTIRWLQYGLANRTSSDSYEPDVSYQSSFEVTNHYSGEQEAEEFFLRNFTDEEERLVFGKFLRWRRYVEAQEIVAQYAADQAIGRVPADRHPTSAYLRSRSVAGAASSSARRR